MAGTRLQGIAGFIGLLAVCAGLGYLAWIGLTRPPGARRATPRRVAPANDSLAFVAVAGEGVDLEVIAPDGRRTSTVGTAHDGRIPGSESSVDCPGYSDPGGTEAACTASVNVSTPRPGDYVIVVRSARPRALVVNVGWATESQVKRGGFDVRVQVAPGSPTAFSIVALRDAVSQRSEPRPYAP
ncbi:MAG: hypothetical protein U9Q74_07580 [Gemmatimonadota bacterium]|nr:hypothetical protein [Gemmatimonadota bacterium]